MIDFGIVAGQVDRASARRDRSKGGRPPYATEVMVRMAFLQSLYNLRSGMLSTTNGTR